MADTINTEAPEKGGAATSGPGYSPSESELEDTGLINENLLLRKLDGRLLPAVGILYLLSFLDRSNGTWQTLRAHGKIKLYLFDEQWAMLELKVWLQTYT